MSRDTHTHTHTYTHVRTAHTESDFVSVLILPLPSQNFIMTSFDRLVVLESGLGLESGLESIFAGLGLGLGLETPGLELGLGLGSFFLQVLFKSTCKFNNE